MQRLDQVLRELQPVLKTLNDKSNALVFEAKDKKILSRRGRNNEKMAIDGWRSAVDGVQFRCRE
jgi:paraquat-inducible protein B